ncbi:MAG: Crp/Fnr family transcriptional regulator [Hymenobacter sp.]|nr:Crp/Fnr family transcriptional regulator [Hymenobacter sp.]
MDHDLPMLAERLRQQMARFVAFTGEEWALLQPHLRVITLKKHALFAREGERAADVALVGAGMLRQFYTKDGDEKTTYFFFEDHFLSAYVSCLTGQPSRVTIEALSECRCVAFPYAVLRGLFDQRMAWQRFGRLLAEYLTVGLEERMAGLLLLSPEERYLDLVQGPKKKIMERVPQHYIANYLGITPVSLSRIRNRVART